MPSETPGGLRGMGLLLEDDMIAEIERVKEQLGAHSKAAAVRYLLLQGLEHLQEKEELKQRGT